MAFVKRLSLLTAAGVLIAGCSAKDSATEYYPSGFLDDYGILEPGGKNQARLIYRKPGVDIPATYDRIFLDRATIFVGTDREYADDEREDSVRIATMLYSAFRDAFERNHAVTQKIGPGVLRVRLALTDVGPESEELQMYSTVLPPPEIPADREIDDNTRAFLRSAVIEAEVTDSDTGELVAAAVGRHIGDTVSDARVDTWQELAEVLDEFATRLAARVRAARID